MVTRVVEYDFSGSGTWTSWGEHHGGADHLYGSVFVGGGTEEIVPSTNISGGSVQISGEWPEADAVSFIRYDWGSTVSDHSVRGFEISFKTDSVPFVDLEIDLTVGDTAVVAFLDADGIWYGGVGEDDFDTPIAVDVSQWLTLKFLPTGEWSLAYTGGAVILSGTTTPPIEAVDPVATLVIASGLIATGLDTSRVAPLWLDDIVFWLDEDEDEVPCDYEFVRTFEEGTVGEQTSGITELFGDGAVQGTSLGVSDYVAEGFTGLGASRSEEYGAYISQINHSLSVVETGDNYFVDQFKGSLDFKVVTVGEDVDDFRPVTDTTILYTALGPPEGLFLFYVFANLDVTVDGLLELKLWAYDSDTFDIVVQETYEWSTDTWSHISITIDGYECLIQAWLGGGQMANTAFSVPGDFPNLKAIAGISTNLRKMVAPPSAASLVPIVDNLRVCVPGIVLPSDLITVTRLYPRDDQYGLGSAPRLHPLPRRNRVVGGIP